MSLRRWTPTLLAAALLVAAVPLTYASNHKEDDAPNPANKTAAAGSTLKYVPPDWADDDEGTVILSTFVKSGGPADLLLGLSLECSLTTETAVTTIGDHDILTDTSRAEARVEVWLTIDGEPIPVSGGDDGKVTFCDRVQEQRLEDMDEGTSNWTMRTHLRTKSAHSFNWVTFDVGSGTHLIEVLADINAESDDGALAEGYIGKRTLLVETTRFPNGSSI